MGLLSFVDLARVSNLGNRVTNIRWLFKKFGITIQYSLITLKKIDLLICECIHSLRLVAIWILSRPLLPVDGALVSGFRRMRKVMTKHLIKVIIRMDEHILQIVALYSSLQMKRLNKSLDIPLQRTFEYMLLLTLPLNLWYWSLISFNNCKTFIR